MPESNAGTNPKMLKTSFQQILPTFSVTLHSYTIRLWSTRKTKGESFSKGYAKAKRSAPLGADRFAFMRVFAACSFLRYLDLTDLTVLNTELAVALLWTAFTL